ncbi:MAG: 3'(2'),5'-bisphosphate nucleotidase [Candidatus Aminicenantes bacterium]|nr:3'(2'),5'-bisphosphate nucleotidase [Candidatus Aminicenantes bacterium]
MFEKEFETGKKAVIMAGRLIRLVQQELTSRDHFSKSDRSPVTIADFLSQALICRILKEAHPEIPIVAEEDSRELKRDENRPILERIIGFIGNNEALSGTIDEDNLFESIDMGVGSPSHLYWTLDPIDGTKGFLRGEQFAVALALIQNGIVELGLLGCPNLELGNHPRNKGYLFFARRGQGAEIQDITSSRGHSIQVSEKWYPENMRFVQSYVSEHSDTGLQKKIAEILKIKNPSIHLDSQVKYGLVASGNAEIYLRIPNPRTPDYKEKIWDHAAGSLIVEESGGVVTDIYGKKLDFSQGKTLKGNSGILATIPGVQGKILEIINRFVSG